MLGLLVLCCVVRTSRTSFVSRVKLVSAIFRFHHIASPVSNTFFDLILIQFSHGRMLVGGCTPELICAFAVHVRVRGRGRGRVRGRGRGRGLCL